MNEFFGWINVRTPQNYNAVSYFCFYFLFSLWLYTWMVEWHFLQGFLLFIRRTFISVGRIKIMYLLHIGKFYEFSLQIFSDILRFRCSTELCEYSFLNLNESRIRNGASTRILYVFKYCCLSIRVLGIDPSIFVYKIILNFLFQ